jgi:hypothetical protein
VITPQLSLIERLVELGTPIDAQRAGGQTWLLVDVKAPAIPGIAPSAPGHILQSETRL